MDDKEGEKRNQGVRIRNVRARNGRIIRYLFCIPLLENVKGALESFAAKLVLGLHWSVHFLFH